MIARQFLLKSANRTRSKNNKQILKTLRKFKRHIINIMYLDKYVIDH